MPAEAFAIHGLSTEFLKEHKRFTEIADEFLAFIGDAPLVIHNAGFDHALSQRRAQARRTHVDCARAAGRHADAGAPQASGGPNRLDDLCARYGIDNSRRTKHGALLDAEILAEVYVELIGARQAQLGLAESGERPASGADGIIVMRARPERLAPRLSEAERAAHRDFVASLGENAIWRDYRPDAAERFSRARRVPAPAAAAPSSGDRGRRNRPDRAAAAGSRRCAPRWR